jgi:hypothetical protein
VLSKFKWGPTFLELNKDVLNLYVRCTSSDEIREAQELWLARCELEAALRKKRVLTDVVAGGQHHHHEHDHDCDRDHDLGHQLENRGSDDGDAGGGPLAVQEGRDAAGCAEGCEGGRAAEEAEDEQALSATAPRRRADVTTAATVDGDGGSEGVGACGSSTSSATTSVATCAPGGGGGGAAVGLGDPAVYIAPAEARDYRAQFQHMDPVTRDLINLTLVPAAAARASVVPGPTEHTSTVPEPAAATVAAASGPAIARKTVHFALPPTPETARDTSAEPATLTAASSSLDGASSNASPRPTNVVEVRVRVRRLIGCCGRSLLAGFRCLLGCVAAWCSAT